jgi:hypothetical protein
MFIVGTAALEDDIRDASFCCDLTTCKGACCTLEGGRGAPLFDEEVAEIERAFPIIRRFLREESLRIIEAHGLVDGGPSDYVTPCIEHKECVYVVFQNGIAGCGFERAFHEGLISWQKPLSCHLFPLRVRTMVKDYVHYEQIEECAGGRRLGHERGIALSDFVRDALVRRFGEAWYAKFRASCANSEPQQQ